MIINLFIFFLIYILFFFTIYSYGYAFNYLFFKEKEFNIGEKGILGFLSIYSISVFFHFFLKINLLFSLILFSTSLIIFFLIIKKNEINNAKKLVFFSILIFFISSITSNLHDDWPLYQLPIVNYMQQNKIIFGLVSLNDYYAQGHSFYEIMSVFQLPLIKNKAMYLLPVIFLNFFILALVQKIKDNQRTLIYILFIIIFLLIKYTRSKEYGTDIPVLCLIFLTQIYIWDFFHSKNFLDLQKAILFSCFAIILKFYSFLLFFYFVPILFLINKKFTKFLFSKIYLNIFIFSIIICTIIKNIIISGCLLYPVSMTCFEKKTLSWSAGKNVAHERTLYYNASVKGWKAYHRHINHEKFVDSKKYLEISKFNYFKFLTKDKDFEKILICLFMSIIFFSTNLSFKKKRHEPMIIGNTTVLLTLFFPLLIWFLKIPQSRYGFFAYMPFFIFGLFSILTGFNIKKNFVKFLFVFSLLFFVSKNILRINSEIKSLTNYKSYPFAEFSFGKNSFLNRSFKINNITINSPKNGLWCGNIPMPCSSKSNLISKAYIKNGYYFLLPNSKKIISFINDTSYHDMIEVNDNKNFKY